MAFGYSFLPIFAITTITSYITMKKPTPKPFRQLHASLKRGRNPFVSYISLLILLSLFSCTGHNQPEANYETVPLPNSIKNLSGSPFLLSQSTRIGYPENNDSLKLSADFLAGYIKEMTGMTVETENRLIASNGINLCLDKTSVASDEGYRISITSKTITITAGTSAGIFYGIQTLRKSIPEENNGKVKFPAAVIEDRPWLPYRGMHLDVSRHFFHTDFIKKYIDLIALHNMNVFHWHLTDDQGWRIEIKKYPRLTETGATRKESLMTDGSGKSDGKPYSGFYTQNEIRDIINYAAQRHITVIPEIDLPGHVTAALAAYPELGCTGGPYDVATTYGVHKDVLCVGNAKSLEFAKNVLSEIIALFPSPYIHVGGDECPRDRWKKCPECQRLIREKHWKDTDGHKAEDYLQAYFMNEIAEFVESHGRKVIGWDEVLGENLSPDVTIMAWRGADKGIKAAQEGHDVIMTPAGITYFSDRKLNELGGDRGIRRVYDFTVSPDSLSPEASRHIIGIQACLWTEGIDNAEKAETLVLPRLAALCELGWTNPARHDFRAFMNRLYRLIPIYDKQRYSYSRHVFQITESYQADTLQGNLKVSLSTIGERPIFYTLDGSNPNDSASMRYTHPFTISTSAKLKAQVIDEKDTSSVFEEQIRVNKATFKPSRLANPPHPNYTFNGVSTLTDGLSGNSNYNTGRWLGFLKDMDLTVDLKEPVPVHSVSIHVNVSKGAAVMDAVGLEAWCSSDGKHFRQLASESYPVLGKNDKDGIYSHRLSFPETEMRYVRIIAKVTPALPSWHLWPGDPAFLFVDEVSVE